MSMDDYGGAHPYGVAKGGKGHVIFYCYYTRKYRFFFFFFKKKKVNGLNQLNIFSSEYN